MDKNNTQKWLSKKDQINLENNNYIGRYFKEILENRDDINRYIEICSKVEKDFSIFFISIDNFNIINNMAKKDLGNKLIDDVTEILYCLTSKSNNMKLGHLGLDQFIIIKKGIDIEKIKSIAEGIIDKINEYDKLDKYDYKVSASIGISRSTEMQTETDSLLQYSNIAMKHSKKSEGVKYTIFQRELLEPLIIEKKLKDAIKNESFQMYLQPVYSVENNGIKGFEALIRWFDNDEVIYPDKFIAVAKRTGDIIKIDEFMFKNAVKTAREFLNEGKDNFYISVNASKLFLKQDGIVDFILNELQHHNVESKYINIEVTEDEKLENLVNAVRILNSLRNIGIKIFLDDFGVGYSSFNHIRALPIDAIKIDKSLISNVNSDKKAQHIVKMIIELSNIFKIDAICEGAESIEQINFLKRIGCNNIQGYYFGKPMEKKFAKDMI